MAATVSDGVMRDLVFEDEYWEPYRKTVTADISNKVYDSYLNANNQQSGMNSYGEMVDLLLATDARRVRKINDFGDRYDRNKQS